MNALIIALAAFGVVAGWSLVRKVMCLALLQTMIVLSFILAGRHPAGHAPILDPAAGPGEAMADPLPHALMLTAIVIGVCFNALALAALVRARETRGIVSATDIRDD